jgi:hypothetical protein
MSSMPADAASFGTRGSQVQNPALWASCLVFSLLLGTVQNSQRPSRDLSGLGAPDPIRKSPSVNGLHRGAANPRLLITRDGGPFAGSR